VQATTESTLDRLVRRGKILAGVAIGAGLLYLLRDLAQLVLLAAFIAYVLNPLVVRMEDRMSRNAATIIVFVGLVGVIVGGGALLGPAVVDLVQRLQEGASTENVQAIIQGLDQQVNALAASLGSEPIGLASTIQARLQSIGDSLMSYDRSLLSLVTNLLVVPFVAVFLLRDGPRIKRGLIRLVPNRYFEFTLDALHKVDQQLGKYLRGIVLDVTAVTILAVGALWLIGVDGFFFLGVIAGLASAIPYVGVILGGTVCALLTLLSSGSAALTGAVILTFLAIQVIDEAIIQPLVLSKAVDVHPLEIVLAVAAAGQFFGVLGMLLAVPVVSAAKVVATEGLSLIQQYRFS
jgi:putative permease